jgi:hypothetical protein
LKKPSPVSEVTQHNPLALSKYKLFAKHRTPLDRNDRALMVGPRRSNLASLEAPKKPYNETRIQKIALARRKSSIDRKHQIARLQG